jgi:rod shape-determining protein MreC
VVCDYKLKYFDRIRASLAILTYPIIKVVDFPLSLVAQLGMYSTSHNSLVLENERLKLDSLGLKGELQKLDSLLQENEQLRKLLHAGESKSMYYQVAGILKVDPDPFSHQIVIDKGESNHIKLGQAIIDERGLIGTVVSKSNYTSNVMLISDSSSAIPVENVRNGIRAIAVGTGNINVLKLKHITNTADIKVGDILTTSGLGGKLPAGFPVAKVIDVQIDPSKPFASVTLEPLASLDRNRHVLLIDTPESING